MFTYLFSVVTDVHISQKAKYYSPVNNSSGLFFCLNKQQCKCFVSCIQSLLIVKGRFSGGSGDKEAATTPFFFEILYQFYRILSLYSWQESRNSFLNFLDPLTAW